MSTPRPTPSPSKVGHGAEEEERGNKGAEEKEELAERRKAAKKKTVKTEAGEDGGGSGGGGGRHINIKVTSQTADDVFFRVKRHVKLERIMDMYCGKHSLHPKAVLFLGPEGRHIRRNQTPDEVGLEDGDEISIMLTQVGGAAAREPELSA